MTDDGSRPSRRTVLRSGAGLAFGGLAGCIGGMRWTDDDPPGAARPPRPVDTSNMSTVFEDTFDAPSLDGERWRTNYPWNARTHNYDGYAAAANVTVGDGKLVLRAEEKPRQGKSYTTGVASSRQVFKPGYVEGRIRIPPTVPGFWPAFWLTSASYWPPEIDIFEFFGADPKAWMSYHYMDNDGNHQRITDSYGGADFSDRFHWYGVDWNADRIVWYVDGEERFRYGGEFVKMEYMWLIINFGIAPDFLERPRSRDLPATMEVDTIRVWER